MDEGRPSRGFGKWPDSRCVSTVELVVGLADGLGVQLGWVGLGGWKREESRMTLKSGWLMATFIEMGKMGGVGEGTSGLK